MSLDNEQYNIKKYHISITEELQALKNRVRHLIGAQPKSYLEDGEYKEAILKNVIGRFLPKNFITATGFIVKETKVSGGELLKYASTRQIDIMIIDTQYPTLFSEGDFHIATPESVRAVIEVKTNIQNQNITQIIQRMNKIGEFIVHTRYQAQPRVYTKDRYKLFNGIFSFEGYEEFEREPFEEKIKKGYLEINDYYGTVNFLCLNENYFLRREPSQVDRLLNQFKIGVYKLEKLSFSWFISNLLSFLRGVRSLPQHNLYFPQNKQSEKQFDIQLLPITEPVEENASD